MAILGGVIGETSRLAAFAHKEDERGRTILELVAEDTFDNKDFTEETLPEIIDRFFNQHSDVKENIYAACFAITGPVNNNRTEGRIQRDQFKGNLIAEAFQQKLICPDVPFFLINDMESICIRLFRSNVEDQLKELHRGQNLPKTEADRAVLLLSTGLGCCWWNWNEDTEKFKFKPSELGHLGCVSISQKQDKLLKHLKEKVYKTEFVSWEQVLCKAGLVGIYQSLSDQDSSEFGHSDILDKAVQQDPDPLCREALDMYIYLWGKMTGDVVIINNEVLEGGIYIVNDTPIPFQRLQEWKSTFMDGFTTQEGKFKQDNEKISVINIFEDEKVDDICLWGAGQYAARHIESGLFAIERGKQ